MIGVAVVDITKNNPNILSEIFVDQIETLSDLYDVLLALKKDQFDVDDRIVIHSNPIARQLVNDILNFIDIPEYFVQFVDNDLPTNLDYRLHDSHCIYPWANLMINNLGDIHPCCYYQGGIVVNGVGADVNGSTLEEIYLSDHMRSLRDKFRSGERPRSCEKCWQSEDIGMQSMRQAAKYKFKDIYYRIDYDQEKFSNLKIFDLKLGNSCNLGCKICNSRSSSTIAEQQYQDGQLAIQELEHIKRSVQWSESDHFWDQMLTTINNVRYLDIYGGEPLMTKAHFRFLEKLIGSGVASNIQIDYNTNGTVYSDKFFDIWDHFKLVKLSFSIDDMGDRFEQQRCGASWEVILKNLVRFRERRSEKLILELFPTVNTQNVFWLPELLDWADGQQFDHVNFNILDFPGTYSIKFLSRQEKNNIVDKLKLADRNILQPIINLLKENS